MIYPKLKPRPKSVQTCLRFAGLDRRPGASNRTQNKTWVMGWHDERNLSADHWPRLSVRRARAQATDIDGNSPEDQVVAMCGGDRALILDASGNLWCNGNKICIAGEGMLDYGWTTTPGKTGFTVTPAYDSTGANPAADEIQNELWDAWNGHFGRVVLTYDIANAPDPEPVDPQDPHPEDKKAWYWEDGNKWFRLYTDLGLTPGRTPVQGDSFTVTFGVSTFPENTQIIRMGAYAFIHPGGRWCNVVKLGNGDELTEGTDYGTCYGLAYGSSTLTLTLCDIDGNAYSGVVVSATEPTQEGYWLDTSSDKPVLQEWSVSQSMWVSITSTYVKIAALTQEQLADTLRKGDTVTFEVDCAAGTDSGVVTLLNSDHYLYDADLADQNGGWVIVSGVLPSSSVTVTVASLGTCKASRTIPEMDFVVEAQNRLWGCRYSETDGLNEIYASKLGDFRNWRVYQGLSTDSWTASRGTAAPFTGAVTLGGNPLFFREESLEKVFPSASGAHQIATYSLEGVQQGSGGSMVIIDERLYYKSRMGVCVYSGTLPVSISDAFGEWQFGQATAARHRRKYAVCMTRSDGARLCMVYDTESGDWHAEDETWDGIAITWEDDLYYVRDGKIYKMDGGTGSDGVFWWAVTDDMSLELPEHKWVSRVRIRAILELGATCRVYVSHDDGPWMRKGTLHGNRLCSQEFDIWPRRCDHFRIKMEGTGGFMMQSLSYQIERSQGGM